MLSDSEVQRALIIAAHPDDIDFSAAGTVALWTDAGIEVTYCLVTDGDAGGFDDSVPRAEMGPLRRKEQTAAAACVGVHDLRFLGYPDGQVEPTLALRKDLARVIRQVRPDRVLVPVPGALLPAARHQPPGSPRGRLGRAGRGLPGRAQPVRVPGTAPGRGPGAVDGA